MGYPLCARYPFDSTVLGIPVSKLKVFFED